MSVIAATSTDRLDCKRNCWPRSRVQCTYECFTSLLVHVSTFPCPLLDFRNEADVSKRGSSDLTLTL